MILIHKNHLSPKLLNLTQFSQGVSLLNNYASINKVNGSSPCKKINNTIVYPKIAKKAPNNYFNVSGILHKTAKKN
jgi:hypothetical protein